MAGEKRSIPFRIEVIQVIDLLAKQIYQSPLALLRENCQNAFDAILMRRRLGQAFEAQIGVDVSPVEVRISDNGIGMTVRELTEHYWRAGSSGKNTPEARAAGVVGTFGIGAMANFGVAEEMEVRSESAVSGERTLCHVERAKLSATEDCIDMIAESTEGKPGTTVIARIDPAHAVVPAQALEFLKESVSLLPIPVWFNGTLISGNDPETLVQRPEGSTRVEKGARLGASFVCDIETILTKGGQVWVSLQEIVSRGRPMGGRAILRQDAFKVKTYRSWFGLSSASFDSSYNFGGVVNLQDLQPTAGRDALTTESLQLLQALITELEDYISQTRSDELSAAANPGFLEWVDRHSRFQLLGKLPIRLVPGGVGCSLEELRARTIANPNSVFYYDGNNMEAVEASASEEKPVCVVSRNHPRRRCEVGYIQAFCKCEVIDDQPKVVSTRPDREWSIEESALAFRVTAILANDYFVPDIVVLFGKTRPRVPLLVRIAPSRTELVLDSDSTTVALMLDLYRTDPDSLTSMAKDFVRSNVFPRIQTLVPSSTRQGAEAFLRLVRKPRDVFEYDLDSLGNLPDIWKDYLAGKISMAEAAKRSANVARLGVQSFDRSSVRPASTVIADVLSNQEKLSQSADSQAGDPLPAIVRADKESDAKLLTINSEEPAINGYRCFVALSDRAFRENSRFFLQPHRTEIVWSGQKVLYVFQHHSGTFGLYYELQAEELVSHQTGGRAFPTSTVVIKNQVYIPVPEHLKDGFIPHGSAKKRFDVRCDLLYPDLPQQAQDGAKPSVRH